MSIHTVVNRKVDCSLTGQHIVGDKNIGNIFKTFSVSFGCIFSFTCNSVFYHLTDRIRCSFPETIAGKYISHSFKGCCIWHSWSRSDHIQRASNHVGKDHCCHGCWFKQICQSPAFDHIDMFTNRIHLLNLSTTSQQLPRHFLHLIWCNAINRCGA